MTHPDKDTLNTGIDELFKQYYERENWSDEYKDKYMPEGIEGWFKTQLLELILEIIGVDERVAQTEDMDYLARSIARNRLKEELRQAFRKAFGGKS